MSDEKKTYLIDIQSNLKTYAEDAAKAKKIADELKLSLDELKKAGAKPEEIEAATAAHKNANDEYRKAAGLLKTAIANNLSEAGSRKQLSEQLKLQEQALGKLGSAYIKDAQGITRLNPAYIEQRNQIAATKKQIIDYDLALNDGRSNIGRYGESVKGALGGLSQLPGPIGNASRAVSAFGTTAKTAGAALKTAFISNPIGIVVAAIVAVVGGLVAIFKKFTPVVEAVERAMAGIKAVFSGVSNAIIGLVTGQKTLKESFSGLGVSIKNAYEEGVKWKQLQQDLFEMTTENAVADAKRKTQIDELLLQSRNRTKSEEERSQLIGQALLLEEVQFAERKKIADAEVNLAEQAITKGRAFTTEELKLLKEKGVAYANEMKMKKNITEEDIKAYSAALVNQEQTNNEDIALREKAMNRQDQIDQQAEKKRQTAIDKAQKIKDELRKQDIEWSKEQDAFLKETFDRWDKEAETKWNSEVELQRKIFDQNRKAGQAEFDARIKQEEALAEAVIKIHETTENAKMSIARSASDFLSGIAGENKALQTTALIAEKAFAIAEVVVSTTKANATIRAMAAASVLPGPGYLIRLGASMAAAAVPINLNRVAAAIDIATIIASTISGISALSKSSTSGSSGSSGPTSISSSASAQKSFANPVGSSILTQAQLSQSQLNAVPNQNPLTAEALALALSLAISKLPNPIVSVEDINAKIKSVNKIVVRASF